MSDKTIELSVEEIANQKAEEWWASKSFNGPTFFDCFVAGYLANQEALTTERNARVEEVEKHAKSVLSLLELGAQLATVKKELERLPPQPLKFITDLEDENDALEARLSLALKVVEAARHLTNIYNVTNSPLYTKLFEAIHAFDEVDK